MAFDRIIKGGNVVTPAGAFIGDVGITGEKISALGVNLEGNRSTKLIDAKGHHVLPGVLDVHVHLELPFMGAVSADDYRTGTRAGARGGVTTLIDFAIPYAGESLSQAADNWMKKAEGKSLIDYTFHICITRWNEHKDQIKGMVDRGFTTFKEFMIYESEGWQSDDRAMFGTLEKMKEYGTMLLVHAESARVLDELIARHHTPELMQKYGARLHPMTRPNFIEAEAIQRAVQWCAATGGQLWAIDSSGRASLVTKLGDGLTPEGIAVAPPAFGKFAGDMLVSMEGSHSVVAIPRSNPSNFTTVANFPGEAPERVMLIPANNRFSPDAIYALHAWIWKDNPHGTFAMWNPTVHCPAA